MYHGRLYFSIFLIICATIATVILFRHKNPPVTITNFDQCAAAGYPVMQSYPRQCTLPTGKIFVEQVLIKEK